VDLELNGKVAIVTGGSRGIGKAIAWELAKEGVNVAIVARGKEALEATAKELAQETGRRILPISADTGDDESVKVMTRQAVEEFGRMDILVNCAAKPLGRGPVPDLSQITADDLWEEVNVKVMGYLRCAREAAPYMKSQGWGRIINISGMAARNSGNTIGSIRNIGVTAMTKNLADELGPSGINVTVVYPGMTWTERMPDLITERALNENSSPEEIKKRLDQANSIKRMVDASEVAYVVAFLASPKSIAITGDVVAAGGGVRGAIRY
jgi:NAD(P)-dependent dehydrogenase (short-subunit alcohol dehydrogenase family)